MRKILSYLFFLALLTGLVLAFLFYRMGSQPIVLPKDGKTLFPVVTVPALPVPQILAPATPPEKRERTLRFFSFDPQDALSDWKTKNFKGSGLFEIQHEGANGFIHSLSDRDASGRFYPIVYDAQKYPHVSWMWKVSEFPAKPAESDAKTLDDYPARLYFIFAGSFMMNMRVVEYVWDAALPAGSILTSPYTNRVRQIVIRSGNPENRWYYEERDLYQDFTRLFGEAPADPVRAVALMADTDNTQSRAESFWDSLWLGELNISSNEPEDKDSQSDAVPAE